MNVFEVANKMLDLLPIPRSVQLLILNLLIGYGTPSAKALKTRSDHDAEIPIRVVRVEGYDRCKYIAYYMDGVIMRCYDYASYDSKLALFELHSVYLLNKKIQTPYIISQLELLSTCLKDYTKNRHSQLIIQEELLKKENKKE
jgi:hypothetical protein